MEIEVTIYLWQTAEPAARATETNNGLKWNIYQTVNGNANASNTTYSYAQKQKQKQKIE